MMIDGKQAEEMDRAAEVWRFQNAINVPEVEQAFKAGIDYVLMLIAEKSKEEVGTTKYFSVVSGWLKRVLK